MKNKKLPVTQVTVRNVNRKVWVRFQQIIGGVIDPDTNKPYSANARLNKFINDYVSNKGEHNEENN